MTKENKEVSRRQFLFRAGTLAAGTVAFAGLAGCTATTGTTFSPAPDDKAQATPWTYKKLDVDKVRRRAYENYTKGGCMYAAGVALLQTLREDNPDAPWGTLPDEMFMYGAGGGLSWGTLCGALNGALLVMGLALKGDVNSKLGNELMGWYTEFPFPSNKHEEYAKYKEQITTVAASPLCHASVSKWAVAAGAKINEEEKKDRCAKLSADVAAKAAELMNESLENTFTPVFKPNDQYSHCMACHTGPESTLDNEQGKMNCTECHDDHTRDTKNRLNN